MNKAGTKINSIKVEAGIFTKAVTINYSTRKFDEDSGKPKEWVGYTVKSADQNYDDMVLCLSRVSNLGRALEWATVELQQRRLDEVLLNSVGISIDFKVFSEEGDQRTDTRYVVHGNDKQVVIIGFKKPSKTETTNEPAFNGFSVARISNKEIGLEAGNKVIHIKKKPENIVGFLCAFKKVDSITLKRLINDSSVSSKGRRFKAQEALQVKESLISELGIDKKYSLMSLAAMHADISADFKRVVGRGLD